MSTDNSGTRNQDDQTREDSTKSKRCTSFLFRSGFPGTTLAPYIRTIDVRRDKPKTSNAKVLDTKSTTGRKGNTHVSLLLVVAQRRP